MGDQASQKGPPNEPSDLYFDLNRYPLQGHDKGHRRGPVQCTQVVWFGTGSVGCRVGVKIKALNEHWVPADSDCQPHTLVTISY